MDFTIETRYWDDTPLYTSNVVHIERGLNVLVGCNGCGKTTLLLQLEESIKQMMKNDKTVKLLKFDNAEQGGDNFRQRSLFYDDMDSFMSSIGSSEGELITLSFGTCVAKQVGSIMRSNKDVKEFYILIDGVDSGLSIDRIRDLLKFFKFVQHENRETNFYIIASANSYEMTINNNCIDVMTLDHIGFPSYTDYCKYILKTRNFVEDRSKSSK